MDSIAPLNGIHNNIIDQHAKPQETSPVSTQHMEAVTRIKKELRRELKTFIGRGPDTKTVHKIRKKIHSWVDRSYHNMDEKARASLKDKMVAHFVSICNAKHIRNTTPNTEEVAGKKDVQELTVEFGDKKAQLTGKK